MSIKTNKKYWEEIIIKDKKKTEEDLKSGMINLKAIPLGKSLSALIGGKLDKQNNKKEIEDQKDIRKENLAEKKNISNNNSKNKKNDDSFSFGNFLNSQNINELFGLDEIDNNQNQNQINNNENEDDNKLDIEEKSKTNDNSSFNFNYHEGFNNKNNNLKNENIFLNYNNIKEIDDDNNNIDLNFEFNQENKNNKNDNNKKDIKNNNDFLCDDDFRYLFDNFQDEISNKQKENNNDNENIYSNINEKTKNNIDSKNNNFNYDKKSKNSTLDSFLNEKNPINNSFHYNLLKNQNNINENIVQNKNQKNMQTNNINITSSEIEKNPEDFKKEYKWDEEVEMCNLKNFGHKKFRPLQREIINASLCDRDIFVCMPTGGGKSLTYQIPALIKDGVTLVVMPLLSLIQDQTSFLQGSGINVLFLNSENTINLNYDNLFHSENEEDMCKMIFLTPEKIAKSNKTMNLLHQLYNEGLLARCVVDEAHCVSKWGREFRSDYLNLKILKQKFPKLPILALTATAPNLIRDDVINQLGMKDTVFFKSSYNRKNLYIEIRKKTKGFISEIASYIKEKHPRETGLIYCTTKKNCETIAKELKNKHKIKCDFYHASLPEQKKNKIQEKWKNDQIQVIVATVAFGMGINKSDVRFVIHNSMPSSFESYYQEIGRAGRDGNPSDCILYYSAGDRKSTEFLISKTNLDNQKLSENLRKITQMVDYCEEQFECRRVLALEYFDEKFDSKDCNSMCDNCKKRLSCIKKDSTKVCLLILNFLKNCSDKMLNITIIQSVDYLMGKSGKQHITWPSKDNNKGVLKSISVDNIKKMFRKLIIMGYINEYLVINGNNVYSRIEISKKGKNYLQNKNNNEQNDNEPSIYITFRGQEKEDESNGSDEESSEEEPIDDSTIKDKDSEIKNKENSILNNSNHKNNDNKLESSVKKGKNKSTEGKKKKKRKKIIEDDEEDFGLCQNKKLFDELFMKLKNLRGEILQREKNLSGDNDDDDNENEDFNLSAIKNGNKNQVKYGIDDIFTDNGLKELCRKLPTLEKELNINNIYGVNRKSLKTYGKEFLPVIIKFIGENNIHKNEQKDSTLKENKNENNKKWKKTDKKGKKEDDADKHNLINDIKIDTNKNTNDKKDKKCKKEESNSKLSVNSDKGENNKNNDESKIIIPENGIYAQNEDIVNLFDNNMEEPNSENKDNNINNQEKNENSDDLEEELEEMKEGFSSQKAKTEELDKLLLDAKNIAKNNMRKYKRSQEENDDDISYDDYMGKKKKKSWGKYNFFQRKAIFQRMAKGKRKKQ